jgi:hypothetical protein
MTEIEMSTIRDALKGTLGSTLVDGVVHVHRLPQWTRGQYGADELLPVVAAHGSGVRLELETAATWLELTTVITPLVIEGVELPAPRIVVEVGGADQSYSVQAGHPRDLFSAGVMTLEPGAPSVSRFELPHQGEPIPREVTIWLPHSSRIAILGVDADASVAVATGSRPRWIHYGSSISHCLEADSPVRVWPVAVARECGLDLLSLGLAGEALLDPFAARAIRDTPADMISLKIGINIVEGSAMRSRTFVAAMHGFLDTVREGHPDTPVLVVSPIFCPAVEEFPGPSRMVDGVLLTSGVPATPGDGQLTLTVVRNLLRGIVEDRATTDPNLDYLDGRELFGASDLPHMPDHLHPNTHGYGLMSGRFAASAWMSANKPH